MSEEIANLLAQRGARFSGREPRGRLRPDPIQLQMAQFIANNFRVMDSLKNALAKGCCWPREKRKRKALQFLCDTGYVRKRPSNQSDREVYTLVPGREEFIMGGWLEILAHGAILEAGADAAVCGQRLEWGFEGYSGENEIDVIALRGKRLVFVSCKATQVRLAPASSATGKQQRKRMRAALDEADNWVDHFGDPGRDCAVLLMTTDMIDEANRHAHRYPALMGKARALHVHLLSLEDMTWRRLVARLREILTHVESG